MGILEQLVGPLTHAHQISRGTASRSSPRELLDCNVRPRLLAIQNIRVGESLVAHGPSDHASPHRLEPQGGKRSKRIVRRGIPRILSHKVVFVHHHARRYLFGILELSSQGPHVYGGPYDEYVASTGREAPGMRKDLVVKRAVA